MNQQETVNGIPNIPFHPQLFENINRAPGKQTDLERISRDRASRLPNVDISDMKSPGSFKLTPKKNYNINKTSHHDVLSNIQITTLLSSLFFSERNIQDLQKLIRMSVYKHMNQVIDNQSVQELLIIMRATFLEYALHPKMLESAEDDEEREEIVQQTIQEVRRLNELIVNETVPLISSQLQQYKDYLRDASSQPVQMNLPVNESIKGQKSLRSVTDVFLGTGF